MGKGRTEQEWEMHEFPYENKGSNSLQHYVLNRLKEHKDHVTVVKVMKANRNGVSDLLLCVDGRFTAIELKIRGNGPTEHQTQFLCDVQLTKGVSGLAYNWKDVKELIREAGYAIG